MIEAKRARPVDRRGVQPPRVAVYRRQFLPRSETFVRDHLLHMPRYATRAVTSEVLPDPLPVPGVEPLLPADAAVLPRVTAALLRRARRPAHEVGAPALAAALRSTGADVVHAHFGVDAAWALPAVRLAGKPFVVTFHGYDATMRPEVLRASHGGTLLVDRFDALVRRAGAVVTVSDYLRDRLLARGVPPEKLHVVPCGVDVDRTSSPAPPPPGGPLLFVGRLTEKKGLADLLDALAGVPGAPELLVVGDGPLRQDLEAQARRLRARVRFLGMRSSDEVAALMDSASSLCLPSRTAASGDCEGLPVTALEAGLHARAVVGYAHSGIPEAVLDERTGLLAPEGDVPGLRDRLRRLVADEDLRRDLGAAARARVVEHFGLRLLLGRLADVYDALLVDRRSPALAAQPPDRRRARGRPRVPVASGVHDRRPLREGRPT